MDPVHTRSKSTCGKVEVSVRVREPFVSKDTEEVIEKWLVVDAEPTGPLQQQQQQQSNTQNKSGKSEESSDKKQVTMSSSAASPGDLTVVPAAAAGSQKSLKNRGKSPKPPPRTTPLSD